MNDLPETVDQHLAAHFPDDGACGWQVHRNLDDGTAAVTFRPGLLDTAPVRAQTLDGEVTARKFAADVREFNAWYHAKYPGEDAPDLIPTVFHYGVPAEPEPVPQIEGQTVIALVPGRQDTPAETRTCTGCDGTSERRDFNADGEFESVERCGGCDGTGRVAVEAESGAAR